MLIDWIAAAYHAREHDANHALGYVAGVARTFPKDARGLMGQKAMAIGGNVKPGEAKGLEGEQEPVATTASSRLVAWWRAPAGPRDVLAIAMPLVISTAFWSVQWFVDRLFLMKFSTEAMAAALPAGMAHWSVICLPMGVAAYVNTFVAQYHGAGRSDRIGLSVAQGIWWGIFSTPLILLSMFLAPYLFDQAAYNSTVVLLEQQYFRSLAWGGGAVVLSGAMGAYYTGRGLTRVVMVVQIIGTLVNVFLDYGFVFGEFGLPRWGIVGAGVATSIANWLVVVIYAGLMFVDKDAVACNLNQILVFDRELFGRLVRYGTPGALPMMVEAVAFTLVTFFVTKLGEIEGAATGLAFNVNAVAFIPVMGLRIATSTLVGQYLGENRSDLAAKATWNALGVAQFYTLAFAAMYLLMPSYFLIAHESYAADDGKFPVVKEMTIVLLRFVAVYCIFDAAQVVFVGALKGAGDTVFVLLATTTISICGLMAGYIGQQYFGFGVYGWWSVLSAWIFTLGLVYFLRFRQGRWRSMRVIEEMPVKK